MNRRTSGVDLHVAGRENEAPHLRGASILMTSVPTVGEKT